MSKLSEKAKVAAAGAVRPPKPNPSAAFKASAMKAGKGFAKQVGNEVMKDLSAKAVLQTTAGLTAAAAYAKKRFGPKPTMGQRLSKGLKTVFGNQLARRLGTFGAGAAGIAGGVAAVDALRDALTKKVSQRKQFSAVLKENPALAKDKEHAMKVFKTLRRFNPEMAADPLVAGSFLKRSIQYKDEGIQPMDVKVLTEIGKNMRDRGGDSFLGKVFGDVTTARGLASMAGG